jgi:hypothetical protein
MTERQRSDRGAADGGAADRAARAPWPLRVVLWAPRRTVGAVVHLVLWTVLLPWRLLRRSTVFAFRTGLAIGTAPVRAMTGVVRRLGLVSTVCLVTGIAVGLLVAPVTGRQLRQRIRTLVGGALAVPDGQVHDAVVAELADSPRTGHLPRPSVSVVGGVVTLDGEVPHETARLEVEAAVAGVPGVQGVVNHLATA